MKAQVTEQAAALAVEATSRALRLPTVREQAGPLAEAALRDRLSHLAYLGELLSAELEDREARRRERRTAEARFPRLKHLADFDLKAAPTVDPVLLAALERCEWVERGEPVVLLGDSGTGKSHLLIGLGLAACQRGLRMRYTTAAQLVNELAERTNACSRAWSPATGGSTCCAGLPAARSPGGGTAPPGADGARGAGLGGGRLQRPLLGVGTDLRRPPARRRRRRPADLPRTHHRDRQRVLSPAGHLRREGGCIDHLIAAPGVGPLRTINWGQTESLAANLISAEYSAIDTRAEKWT